jgi:hypothetical protein
MTTPYDYRETLDGEQLAKRLNLVRDANQRNVYVMVNGRTYRVVGIDLDDIGTSSIWLDVEDMR